MRRLPYACLVLAALAALPTAAVAQGINPSAAQPALTPAQQDAVDALVGRWIAAHPEALRQALDPVRAAGLEDPDDGTMGPALGDVAVVAFLDRASPASAASVPLLVALAAQEPHARLVFKELPLMSAQSVALARIAVAARKQGEKASVGFEAAMMVQPGPPDVNAALAAAARAGLDMERLRADAASPGVMDYLRRVRSEADGLGIRSTPTFLVGDKAMTGVQSLPALRAAVAAARSRPPH